MRSCHMIENLDNQYQRHKIPIINKYKNKNLQFRSTYNLEVREHKPIFCQITTRQETIDPGSFLCAFSNARNDLNIQ